MLGWPGAKLLALITTIIVTDVSHPLRIRTHGITVVMVPAILHRAGIHAVIIDDTTRKTKIGLRIVDPRADNTIFRVEQQCNIMP